MLHIMVFLIDQGNALFGNPVIFLLHMQKLMKIFLFHACAAFTKLNVKSKQETDAAEIRERVNSENIIVKVAAERSIRKSQAQVAEKEEDKTEQQGIHKFP